MNDKLYKRLEIFGGAVVFAIASLLHFIYNLTGESILGALFGAVNESVWEHLKVFAIPIYLGQSSSFYGQDRLFVNLSGEKLWGFISFVSRLQYFSIYTLPL